MEKNNEIKRSQVNVDLLSWIFKDMLESNVNKRNEVTVDRFNHMQFVFDYNIDNYLVDYNCKLDRAKETMVGTYYFDFDSNPDTEDCYEDELDFLDELNVLLENYLRFNTVCYDPNYLYKYQLNGLQVTIKHIDNTITIVITV